jgi:DNA repair exonuclease SbcCD nuclease subunit
LFEKYSTRNPLKWIAAHTEPAIAIGLAHGTLQGVGADQADYPITKNGAEETGLDYIALGHWHSYLPMPSSDGGLRLAYSGTHETTKFGERASGNALLVEIAARGAKPIITPHRTGGLTWEQWPEALQAGDGKLAALCQRIEQLPSPETTLLELNLSGLFSPTETNELARLEELLAARLFYGRVNREGLLPSPDDDAWITELPAGVLQVTAERLRQQTNGSAGNVASRALLELYRLAQEAR